jgi:multidrug efflux pump subunit AcrB
VSPKEHKTGLAGRLARLFVESKLTPLATLASLLLGILALSVTPREEEPQIVVPMVDVAVAFPGASPREVEERITTPMEKILWGIPDVEYIYSASRAGGALVTVRFKVGTPLEPAVVRVHHRLRERMPEKPEDVTFPLIRSYTIDDVPFLALTLHSPTRSDYELRTIAQRMTHEMAEVADVSRIDVIGGQSRVIRIVPDLGKQAQNHVSLAEYFEPLRSSNVEGRVGTTRKTDPEWLVDVGAFFESAREVENVVVGIKGGRAVRVKDVARVTDGPGDRIRQVLYVSKGKPAEGAVTLSMAKRPGRTPRCWRTPSFGKSKA